MIIGIYGGSFDPIHTGHAIVANFVSQCGVVDEVWLMVSKRNPMKTHSAYATDEQRLEMARMVASNCHKVFVTDIEMQLPEPSYTYDTLKVLQRIYPEHSFKIIIGSDSLENFERWKNHDKLLKEFGLIVYPRPGYSISYPEPEGMIFLNGAPEFSISSSLLREYVASGWNINYLVPVVVSQYIRQEDLYR